MAAIVKTTNYWNQTLAALINATLAAPVVLSAAKHGLGQANITPAKDTAIADLTEASFVGYSRSATIVWSALTNELDGSQTTFSPAQLFRCTTSGPVQTIQNGFVCDGVAGTGAGILGSYKIQPGIPIANVGDGFSVVIGWNEGVATPNSEAVLAT